jgi:predicted branched-subunit amino acid permease
MLPLLAGYAPFACLIGVAVAGSSAPLAAWSGVWLVFAGSAHLTVVQLVDAGSSVAVAALSAVVINVRLALYSATLSPHWRGTSVGARLRAAATLIDPTWMVANQQAGAGADSAAVRRFYGGASVVLWFGWAALVTLGAVVGNLVPPSAGLGLLAPMCLFAMVLPGARSRSGAACVLTAGAVAVLGADLPAGCGLLLAMPAGVAAALVAGRLGPRARGLVR